MSSRRSRGRFRYHRRRAHAARPKKVSLAVGSSALGLYLSPQQEKSLAVVTKRSLSGRATCPGCGNRERVKKDGTMGQHTSAYGGTRQDCSGVGQRPEEDE